MSHVVENALRNNEVCQDLLLAFRKKINKDGKLQLSELAAHFMLKSEAFNQLLAVAFNIAGLHFDPHLADKMSMMVIGEPVTNNLPLLHELISGPFDADKLDYMPRDARMCGVPVVTDIDRLIQKIRATQLSESELPYEIAEVVESSTAPFTIIGLAPSGASTLDEVAIGRSLMFDKIYRHHKVRAAEAMVAVIVENIGDLLTQYQPLLPLVLHDEELLTLNSSRISEMVGGAINVIDESRVAVGLDIVDRLSQRRLFVRAFAFSQHMPEDPYRGDADQAAGG